MTSKAQQIKNSFFYLAPTLVGNLLPLITLPIFTRILSKEEYGAYFLALAYAMFVNGIANFGLTVGYDRNFFEQKDLKGASQLLYSAMLFVIVTFLLSALLTYLFRLPLSRLIMGSTERSGLLFWAFCSVGIMGLKNYYLTYYKNKENAKAFVFYTIDESLLGVILSLVLVALLRLGVLGLVWAQLLASLTIFSVLSFRFVKLHPVTFSWPVLKDLLKLSYPLTPRIFFGIIGNQFDKYLIGLINTIGGVGIYGIGQKVAYFVFSYMTALQNVYSPQVFRRMFDLGEKGGEAVGKYLTPYLYASILIALMISLFSEEVITLLTPQSYHGAIEIVTILSMYYGSMFFGKQPNLIFTKKTHITSALTLFSILVNVAINIPMIRAFGMLGAAWGTLIAWLISGSVSFIINQHYYEIKWEYQKVGLILFLFYGFSVVTILLRNIGVDYVDRLFIKCLALGLFFILGVKIKILTKTNFLIVKDTIIFKNKTIKPEVVI